MNEGVQVLTTALDCHANAEAFLGVGVGKEQFETWIAEHILKCRSDSQLQCCR